MNESWGEAAGLRYVSLDPRPRAALPLIVAIHGRGADATDLAGLASEIGPEACRWIFPQGPLPVSLGPGFTGWAWYELGDRQSLMDAKDVLLRFLDQMLGQLGVGPDRTALVGFSQGGVMALSVGLSFQQPFAGIVAMSGHLPDRQPLSTSIPSAPSRRVLMVHGTYDPLIPVSAARAARDWLEATGAAVDYREFPMGHQITPHSLEAVRVFLREVLPPEPGP